jgi:hypothetical protein
MTLDLPHPRRRFAARRQLAVLAFACLTAPSQLALAAAPDSESAAATDANRPRVLYRQAEAAFAAGKIDDARRILLEAWSVRQTYDVAAALGQAELELKLYRDAAEHLDFAVRNFAPLESEVALDGVKNDLRAAKSQVAEVRIAVNEPGAIISVNGKAVGQSPLTASIFLDPGNHAFGAKLADRTQDKRMALARGGSYDLQLVIPPASALPADTATPADKSYTPPIIAAVAGGVAIGAGIALLVIAGSKDQEREDLLDSLPGTNPCGAGSPSASDCAQVSDLADSARNLRTGAIISFGAAVGAGVATYLLWPKEGHPKSAKLFRAVPSYSPLDRTFQLSATGRF